MNARLFSITVSATLCLYSAVPAVSKTVTFAAPITISPGGTAGAGASEACDFDKDGRAEFISADVGSGAHFRIYDFNTSTGDFDIYNVITPADAASRLDRFGGDLATGDIDGDGWDDIVVPESKNGGNNGSLHWFENPDGNLGGTWIEHTIDTWSGSGTGNVIAHMSEVDVGDIDGDGKLDVVTRDISHGVFVLLQKTDGSGWRPRRFIPTNPREGLDLFNPDGDNDLDIILNGVWLETPSDPLTGTYTLHTYGADWYPSGSSNAQVRDYASQIAVADFNGDTRDDIAISNSEELTNAASTDDKPKGIQIFLAPADPKTQAWTVVTPESEHFSWHSLEPADLDCDGSPDFISAISDVGQDNASAQVSMFINNGSTSATAFTKTPIITSGIPLVYNSTLADADGDGDADLFAPNSFNTGPMRYFENTTEVPTTPPAVPTDLVATATSESSIGLAWTDGSTNETGFQIGRMTTGGTFTLVTTTAANITALNDTGLTPETTYTYRVRATNAAGDSAYTQSATATTLEPDTTPPTVPTGFTATAVSAFQIGLAWTASTDNVGVTAYRISQGGTVLDEIAGTTYSVTGLQPETSYTFTVIALDAAGNESPSSGASATTQAAPELSGFLVAHWPLDDASGATASEALGRYPATLTGSPVWSESGGQIGGALRFTTDADHATAAAFDLPPDNTGITLAAWVRIDSFAGNAEEARFISKASSTDGNNHYWMLGNNGGSSLRFRLKTSASTNTTTLISPAGQLVADGTTWTHVAATYDGGTMRLFKNGEQVDSVAKTGTVTAAPTIPVGIGNQPAGSGGRALDGLLDDVRIYSRALTAGEIMTIMALSVPSAFDAWKTANSIPAGALPASDDDSDGLPLFMEYALATNPNAFDSSPYSTVLSDGGETADFSFPKMRADVLYEVMQSTDLTTWTSVDVFQGAEDIGTTVTVTVPLSSPLFLRLRVEAL